MLKVRSPIIRWLVLISTIFFTACEPVTQAKGVLYDESGHPLQEVLVVLESNANTSDGTSFKKESEQKTGADGSFNFVTITAPAVRARLIIKKEGYKALQKEIKTNSENDLQVIVLEPELK